MHEMETRELLEGIEENCVSLTREINVPPGKSMNFHRKETEKMELVARPALAQGTSSRYFDDDDAWQLVFYHADGADSE